MKKRVGILTVQRAVNFGAALQMYGLYKTVEKIGGNPYIIDYRSKVIEDRENYLKQVFKLKFDGSILKRTLKKIDYIISLVAMYKKKKKFDIFLHQKFNLSKQCGTDTISDLNREFDVFIAGSDQIWNRKLNDDDNYYLAYSESSKKVSYAASFGNIAGYSLHKDRNLELLKDFNQISLREAIGKEEIIAYTKKDVFVHVDPALLLDAKEWEKIVTVPREVDGNGEYLLLYWASSNLKRYAYKLAQKNGWIIYDINEGIPHKGIRNLRSLSPTDFLGAIKNAKYVCTTSFHGMVFSLIYHIPFMVDYGVGDTVSNMRQKRLLEILEVKGHNLSKKEEDNLVWDNVDRNISKEKDKAIEYLIKCLK